MLRFLVKKSYGFATQPKGLQVFNQFLFKEHNPGQLLQNPQSYSQLLSEQFAKARDGKIRGEELKMLLKNATESSFAKGDFKILADRDFQMLVRSPNPNLQESVKFFLNQKFFENNQNFIDNNTISSIIEQVQKRPEKSNLLELIKYHQQFYDHKDHKRNFFHSEEDFEQFLNNLTEKSKGFDALSIFYHFYHLNNTNIMSKDNLKNFIQHLQKIRWGTPKQVDERLNFQGNHISDLLNYKFKYTISERFQLFLADIFFGSQTYKDALLSISLIFTILGRLTNHSNQLNDLFHAFKSTFGEERFKFYIENQLPIVLQTYHQSLFYFLFEQGLKNYKLAIESKTTIQWKLISPLDKYFTANSQIFYQQDQSLIAEPIYYIIDDGFNLNKTSIKQKANDNLLDLIQNNEIKKIYAYVEKNIQGKITNEKDFVQNVQRALLEDDTQYSPQYDVSMLLQTKKPEFKTFVRTNRSRFSSQKESQNILTESDTGAGFMAYLQKVKDIEQQEVQSSNQKKQQSNVEQFGELNNKQEAKHVFFTKISNEKISQQEETQDQSSVIKKNEEIESQQKKGKEKLEEFKIVNQELYSQVSMELAQILKNPNHLKDLELYFINLNPETQQQLYAQNYYLKQMDEVEELILMKMMCDPITKTEEIINVKRIDLLVTIENRYGTLEKDYKNYLGNYSVFPYETLPQIYTSLFQLFQKEEGKYYRRRLFKQVFTHYIQFSKKMTDQLLNSLLKIIVTQKIPMTLLEMSHLLLKRNIEMNQEQFLKIMAVLYRFPDVSEECDRYFVEGFQKFSWDLSYDMFRPYITQMIRDKQIERHLNMYEMLKDATLLQKSKTTDQSSDRGLSRRQKVVNYVNGYVEDLLQIEDFKSAAKVLNDINNGKFTLNYDFYCNLIHSLVFDHEKAKLIFEQYVQKFPNGVDERMITKLCYVVQKNSTTMVEFFNQVTNGYIFNKNLNFTPDFIQELSVTFLRLQDFNSLTSLMRQVLDNKLQPHQTTRNLWLRAIKRCPDDSQKTFYRVVIDRVFDQKAQDKSRRPDKNTFKDQQQKQPQKLQQGQEAQQRVKPKQQEIQQSETQNTDQNNLNEVEQDHSQSESSYLQTQDQRVTLKKKAKFQKQKEVWQEEKEMQSKS